MPHRTSTKNATRLGNVWLAAAMLAQSILAEGPRGPMLLTINADGWLEAIAPEHPDYEKRVLAPGYIGIVTERVSNHELAEKIREAVLRGLPSS